MSWIPRKRIVVPIDFSDVSLAALPVAAALTGDPARLHVIHVIPQIVARAPGVIWEPEDDERRKEDAAAHLKRVLDERGIPGARVHAAVGDPGREIAHYANTIEADTIVLPAGGHAASAHFMTGSTAERVVRLAHCPVVILRGHE